MNSITNPLLSDNLGEIEKRAEEYAMLKQARETDARLADIAIRIIDELSQPGFSFPVRADPLVSKGTTTFVYEGGRAFPRLYDFLSEILHVAIPIIINDVKFGPGEIIVQVADDKAGPHLQAAMEELRQLVHAKKTKAFP